MHVVFFGDQHLASLGGAQVSMRLQKQFLEKAGHTVTVVAPRMHGAAPDPSHVDLPSIPITVDREYSMTWPGRRADRFIDRAMASRPPADVVHAQADFWGAFLAHRFARRHGVPVVHTMHNRVDVGIRAVVPFPGLVLRMLNAWARRAMPRPMRPTRGVDGWAYLRRIADGSDAVTAPSSHFAARLERHGVFPRVDVVWNGMDDAVLDAALARAAGDGADSHAAVASDARPAARRVKLVWLGRMSPEKRLLPFLEALAESGITADVEVIGGGGQLRAARRIVARRRPAASVDFVGRLSHPETLARLGAADAVVQTSIGFETQGMTPFEAASLGTPAVVTDPDIAAELGGGFWQVPDASVAALAETLRRATDDIVRGAAPAVTASVADDFRQSSRTAAMVEIYRRVVADQYGSDASSV